jgi:hypothetical protein
VKDLSPASFGVPLAAPLAQGGGKAVVLFGLRVGLVALGFLRGFFFGQAGGWAGHEVFVPPHRVDFAAAGPVRFEASPFNTDFGVDHFGLPAQSATIFERVPRA